MKTKTGISLIMALLMIVSTLAVGTVGCETNSVPQETYPFGEVTKLVSDGECWVENIEAEIGETVRFKINLTYFETDHPNARYAKNIHVMDVLPDCLEFDDNVEIYGNINASKVTEEIVDNVIYWNYTSTKSNEWLENGESMFIEFDAIVVECGENVNNVYVTATETCSGYTLEGCDDATVNVPCPPPLEFNKLVKNETGEWSDYLGGVRLGDIVEFRLVITYNGVEGVDLMKCAVVEDWLPACCLEYVGDEKFTYPNQCFDDPEIVNTSTYVKYEWTANKKFNLYAGETLVIEFSAKVIDYCCQTVENCAYVKLWSCWECPQCEPVYVEAEDCAEIKCCPPPTLFEKRVKVFEDDMQQWVEETSTVTGAILTFGIKLEYYGAETLTNIQIIDELPCILEYANNLESTHNVTVELSADGKTIWFNFTDAVIEDGGVIGVTFDALVIGATSECDECECDAENWAYLFAETNECPSEEYTKEDYVKINSSCNCPPTIPLISGPTTGVVGEEYDFSFVSTDNDGDDIYYKVKLDSNEISFVSADWVGPYVSGSAMIESFTFSTAGTYKISAIAKDEHDVESGWTIEGYEHVIVVTEEPEEPEEYDIVIQIPKIFNMGKVSATVKNKGTLDANNVDWQFNIYRGMRILRNIDIKNNGTIPTLEASNETTIKSGAVSLKFGMATIQITAKIGEEKVASLSKMAILMGSIIIVI
jgi:fimbrial isopeptide formation D2 family protein